MEIVYAYEEPTDPVLAKTSSIFLAGPSPRENSHPNWRPEAIDILKTLGFSGSVFIPLPRNGVWSEYDKQVNWELDHLEMARCIAFWIPRSAELPGLTTNVEFGYFARSRKRIVLGAPKNATKMKYLLHLAKRNDIPCLTTLRETLSAAVLCCS